MGVNGWSPQFANSSNVSAHVPAHIRRISESGSRGAGRHIGSLGLRWCFFLAYDFEGVVILMQRTSESLIIEELSGSTGSDLDTAHWRELDY